LVQPLWKIVWYSFMKLKLHTLQTSSSSPRWMWTCMQKEVLICHQNKSFCFDSHSAGDRTQGWLNKCSTMELHSSPALQETCRRIFLQVLFTRRKKKKTLENTQISTDRTSD
jgi:hypothetical protein